MNVLPAAKQAELLELLAAGHGLRAIARRLGLARGTVQRYSGHLGGRTCGCGRSASHHGRCWFRLGRQQRAERGLHNEDTLEEPGIAPVPASRPVEIVLLPPPTFTAEERKSLGMARFQMMKRHRRHRGSINDLKVLAAAATVPVKKYPVGAHTGWRPSWMQGD